jgi:tetraacyldisaccharide 4'-kinase
MPLSAGFHAAVAMRAAAYRRGWFQTRKLGRPVLSVGNLTVGGTGKTPLVEYVADLLVKRGWKPGILTRGYRRRNKADLIPVEPAESRRPDPREIGDEPALLAHKLPRVPMVIGANRYRAGCLAEERFGVDVHILDDGFQHLALARDLDIVVLDATRNLASDALLPAGRLREPAEALVRAHVIVLSRVELANPKPVEDFAGRVNPQARIFHARTKLCELADVKTGRFHPLAEFQDRPVYAFCGVGNPGAFFSDLSQWGFKLAGTASFPDHHVYGRREFALLMLELKHSKEFKGVNFILTTEKDALNLPLQEYEEEVPILACVIRSEIEEAEAFEAALFERLKPAKVF